MYMTLCNNKAIIIIIDALVNPVVAVGYVFPAFHADFLPLPLNWDVASEAEKAWKGQSMTFFFPKCLADWVDVVIAEVLS